MRRPGVCPPHTLTGTPSAPRDKETSRDEFIFYSKRLMRLLIEHALSFLPFQVGAGGGAWGAAGTEVSGLTARRPPPAPRTAWCRPHRGRTMRASATPGSRCVWVWDGVGEGEGGSGSSARCPQITGVSILRAGETMEPALRAVCKDVRIGTILIQTNQLTGEPEVGRGAWGGLGSGTAGGRA